MRLNDYEKKALRQIEDWQRGESNLIYQAINFAMKPVDWLVERVVPESVMDQLSDAVSQGLGVISDASSYTVSEADLLRDLRNAGLDVETLADLRDKPLEDLDAFARSHMSQSAILAAVEGGGAGLGGPVFIAADIPLLFGINFRLIQLIGGSYGFVVKKPEFRPLVLAIYNVAASNSRDARHDAMREISVAAAAFAHNLEYRGRNTGSAFREQNRHVPREIAKNLIGQKLGQMIPIAGAAIGAGVNYWFTQQTAEAAYMLFRLLHIERKERV